MDKLPCEVVRDLLPSYVDGLTSETTNKLVGEHIESCEPCRAALEAMRAPEEAPKEGETREIDYLKKSRRHNRAVLLRIVFGALLVIALLIAWPFIHERELSGVVPYDIRVEGDSYSMKLACSDSASVITSVMTWQGDDGVLWIKAKGTLPSFLHRGVGSIDETSGSFGVPIRRVCTADGSVWWDDGELLALTTRVYQTRHDYVGDMPANGATANALNLTGRFGVFDNELQTSRQPYAWTLRLKSDVPKEKRAYLESEMRAGAYVLLAMVGNLDEVRFAYVTGGAEEELVVTAEDASAFFGREVKACRESPRLLDDLIRKTEMRSYTSLP